jgi:hypothetical protein
MYCYPSLNFHQLIELGFDVFCFLCVLLYRDALRPLFEKKNITFTTVNVFVDSSKTPLPAPASTDTYFVAGKNLIVRSKDTFNCYNSF